MTSVSSLSALFGRDTAASVQHLRLGALLRRLYAACTTPAGRAEVRWQIVRVKRFMSGHFAHEESEACFGKVGNTSGYLAAFVDRLRAEHVLMLELAQQLWARSESLEDHCELAPAVELLLQKFVAHERAELEMMQAFLSHHAHAHAEEPVCPPIHARWQSEHATVTSRTG